jgi:hypothetical protein
VWTQDDSGRVHTPFEPVVLAATLALIPVLIVEADASSDGWQMFAYVTNCAIWAVFAVELAAVLVVARRKKDRTSAVDGAVSVPLPFGAAPNGGRATPRATWRSVLLRGSSEAVSDRF